MIKNFFLSLPGEIYSSIIIVFLISIFVIIIGNKVKKADPLKPSKGLVFLGETIYTTIDNFVDNNMGKHYEKIKPYFMTLMLVLPLYFIAGLFGLPSPINNLSIPLSFALISVVLIHYNSIKYTKWKYFKRYVDPFPKIPIFLPINILSALAPVVSLSFRMFGNALSGTIILQLIYYATNALASKIVNFNFIGPLLTPLLHAYFDLFSGVIQTMVFIYLTTFFVKGEEPEEVEESSLVKGE